jgi:pyrroline-5-carboxylate reductase
MSADPGLPPAPSSIAFVGGGNMARGLVAGLVAAGTNARSVRVAEPIAALRERLHDEFGVAVFADTAQAATGAEVWVLAAKPQGLREICEGLSAVAQRERPLVLSIAAGITTRQLDCWLGGGLAIVRAMPNAPALLGAGVSALYANPQVDPAACLRAERMLSGVGAVVWLTDESKMDAVTAVSGSGPAYVFLLADAMLDAAQALGLPQDVAQVLVLQTLLGSARMLLEDDAPPDELRRRVTSAGGTTQAAMDVFDAGGFRALVIRAIEAARARGRELSQANDTRIADVSAAAWPTPG